MEEEAVVMGLVLVLVAAVVCALIAFVVLPGLRSGQDARNDEVITKVGMQDYVNDINSANKSGHEYDKVQDTRILELRRELSELEHHEPPRSAFSGLAPALSSIANQVRIETPSEANSVPMITLGQLSAPLDGSQVCWGGTCYTVPVMTRPTAPALAPAPSQAPSTIA